MSALETNPRRRSAFAGVLRAFVWLVLLILALATLWTLWRVVQTMQVRGDQIGRIEDRAELYASTATALAQTPLASAYDLPADKLSQVMLVRQFATNTPEASLPSATPSPTEFSLPAQSATPIALPTFVRPQGSDLETIAGTAVPTQVPLIPRDYELVNILLIGSDEELVQDNTVRTDTMIVVSVNTQTGTVAMLSLPRDLFVYVPTPTMQRLNTVYGIGQAFGWPGGGFGLLRQVIFYNFGFQVHYYAKVNFSGFEAIIDRLGGVQLAVDCTYQDYYPVEDFDPARPIEENYKLRTLPVGYYLMNGFDALWYARTRNLSTDFDRGRRQQQLLRAIYRAARDQGLISTLPSLWSEITQVVETDIPFDVMLGLIPVALNLDPASIENFLMIRTYHTIPWQPPTGALAGQAVQLPAYEPIRQLLTDFYTPPTENQLAVSQARIAVDNASGNADWDRVAAERLYLRGLNAYAAGPWFGGDLRDSFIVDQVGEEKGSLVGLISSQLNIPASSLQVQPDPNRSEDYRVVIGGTYNSCPPGSVLPVSPES